MHCFGKFDYYSGTYEVGYKMTEEEKEKLKEICE